MLNRETLVSIMVLTIILICSLTSNTLAVEEINSDLIVFSGEPEGVTAAVAAAREGKNVILLMSREKPE